MRKWSTAAAFVLAGIVVLVLLLPFGRPNPSGTFTSGDGVRPSTSCPSPIVSAWRNEKPTSGGWFGYAPLTSTALDAQPCKTPARHRLVLAVILAVAALLALFLPRRRPTGAADSQPRLAT